MSDEKLYELCKLYGERARLWRQKFAGLLPEVFRRRLYEKKGFGSIYEFAAKLAGMSERQVDVVLNLEKKFEDKPVLKNMLETGEVSINKLARVASIATTENENFWSTQVKLLPNRALEILVRDEQSAGNENLHVHHANDKTETAQVLQLSSEVQQKLLELQNKGIDINTLLLEFLEKRELEIAQKKEELSARSSRGEATSRYIPVKIRKLLKQEHGEKCSIKTCTHPAEQIHHSQRYALSKTHDPHYLAPLCKNHHKIAHSIDIKFQVMRGIQPG